MLKPETIADECTWCQVCPACVLGIHSCCNPVRCDTSGRFHRCACPDGRHARRTTTGVAS